MNHLGLRLHWLFLPPPVRFVWGTLVTSLLAFIVYWSLPGVRWYSTLGAVFQLGGIFITVWQVMEQRKQLSVNTLGGLFVNWWKSFPRKKVHTVSGTLGGSYSVLGAMTCSSQGRVSGGTVEDQVERLWASVIAMEATLAAVGSDLRAHKAEMTAALESVRATTTEQVDALKVKFAGVVTSSPFVVVFGIWLVVCGTWMQLVIAFFHT